MIPAGPHASTSHRAVRHQIPSAHQRPAIALIQRGRCTFEDEGHNACTAGYEAVIIFNEGQPGRTELLTGTLGNPQTIPALGISFADGESCTTNTRPIQVQ